MSQHNRMSPLFALCIFFCVPLCTPVFYADAPTTNESNAQEPRINKIIIKGNEYIPDQAIRVKIPYYPGSPFKKEKTGTLIRSIYTLGYFRTVQVRTQKIDADNVNIIIIVEEKPRVEAITYTGNKHIKEEELNKQIEASTLKAIDTPELVGLEQKIEKIYRDKGYHHASVSAKLELTDNRATIHFTINEGVKSRVKRVSFKGNESIQTKYLRSRIFTREDWLLSMLDKAGTYHPDAVEYDKYTIENLYQSNGFLAARITDVIVDEPVPGDFDVTFVIDEGDTYTICQVNTPGNEILSEEQLRAFVSIRPGQLYSKDAIRTSMENLRKLWGEYGYIYADVQPDIQPDEDTKTVTVTFHSTLGKPLYANRITVSGNYKTREDVIRRQIVFDEGEKLTTNKMDISKNNVAALGYFDVQNGVNWKITKLDDETADLEMIVKEVKTGRFNARLGFGGMNDIKSPTDSLSVNLSAYDLNFMGTGLQYRVSGTYSQEDRSVDLTIADQWLFDRPLYSATNVFTRTTLYEDFNQTVEKPKERITGGSVVFGLRPEQFNYAQVALSAGLEDIRYRTENRAERLFTDPVLQEGLQQRIDRTFQAGQNTWISSIISKDQRNHPLFPTDGYTWAFDTKLSLPNRFGNFSFFKATLDAHWFTPLINQYNLILHLHGFFGSVTSQAGRDIPYRELFHIGGQSTVRGFEFGQIGPSLLNDSIGGTKALTTTAELLFPITPDASIRGTLFYDGGASWDTPEISSPALRKLIKNNQFEYRHAIGFGINMIKPTPLRVDWGFKLDRKRRRGESSSKIHISMSQSF